MLSDHHSYLRHDSVRSLSLFGETTVDHHAVVSNNSTATVATMTMLTQHDVVVEDSSSLPPESSAPWSTRKTILFAEAIGVTAIVIPLLFCFLYHRAAKLGRLPTTTTTTTTSSSARSSAQHAIITTNAATTSEVLGVSDRALRILQQQQQQQQAVADIIEQEQNDQLLLQSRPPLFQRLLSLPSNLLSILLYPIRVLDAGVHSWSTTNADITFLRSVMERLEEERVAQLEDVEERGERLKLAFSKGDVVWEIAEEHFIPPPTRIQDLILKCIDGMEHATTVSSSANGYEERRLAEGKEIERLGLSEEEQTQLDAKNGDDATAMNTINNASINATAIDYKEEGGDKNEEEGVDREHSTKEEEGNEQFQYLSPLMMDETKNEKDRSSSPLMIDEGDEFVGEPLANSTSASTLFSANANIVDSSTSSWGLTSSKPLPPPRSSSPPLDAGEAPAFLYLPHRRSRSRANTNETNSSNLPSLTPSSSSSNNLNLTQSQSLESIASSSNTNNSTKMENATDGNNEPSPEEEDLKSIPNNCAICLSEYVSGDTIVTSCNAMCPHVFHQECIVEWLVKMQVGAPCPCCRRTFVELSPSRPNGGAAAGGGDSSSNNNSVRRTASPEEEERRREVLRMSIQLGIRRGRAFDFSVISLR